MLRKISVLVLLAGAVISASSVPATEFPSTAPSSKQQSDQFVIEIRAVIQAQQEAWNRGDIDGFMNGYARSKSTIFVSEDTVTRGWQTVRDRYRKKYSDRDGLRFGFDARPRPQDEQMDCDARAVPTGLLFARTRRPH